MNIQKKYQPIDCGLYDQLEVACMHRYEVRLDLRNGERAQGVASNLETRGEGEYLILSIDQDNKEFRLDGLRVLKVLSQPRSFDEISFE